MTSDIPKPTNGAGAYLHGKVRPEEFQSFNAHLLSLSKTGAPLTHGLRALLKDMKSSRFKAAVEEVVSQMENGESLSAALTRRSDVFSSLYVSLIKAGETSGNLSGVLSLVSRHSLGQVRMRRRIIEALIYPSILVVAVVVVYNFAARWIIPQFQNMFAEMGLSLPVSTQWLIMISYREVVAAVSCAVILPIAFLWIAGERTRVGRWCLDALAGLFPLARTVERSYTLSQLSATMSMLLRGGIPVLQALEIVCGTAQSPRLGRALAKTMVRVSEGTPLSASMASTGYFPATFTWMLSLAETGAALPEALGDIAELYESNASRAAALLDIVVVPIVVFVSGSLIACVVFSLFAPFISLMERLGG